MPALLLQVASHGQRVTFVGFNVAVTSRSGNPDRAPTPQAAAAASPAAPDAPTHAAHSPGGNANAATANLQQAQRMHAHAQNVQLLRLPAMMQILLGGQVEGIYLPKGVSKSEAMSAQYFTRAAWQGILAGVWVQNDSLHKVLSLLFKLPGRVQTAKRTPG